MEKGDWLRASVYTPLMLYQIYHAYTHYNSLHIDWLTNLGWLTLNTSAIFGILPIIQFRKKGNVPKGKPYTETTTLVTTGIYSIVRHPQFLAGILICISLTLITQTINSLIAGTIAAITYASEVPPADRRLIQKFGQPYKTYQQKVPALNPITGTIKHIKNHKLPPTRS